MARDWTTFTRRITIDHPIKAIYEAWAIPSQLERWFVRSAEYVGFDGRAKGRDREVDAGDGYLWRWYGFLDDVSENGAVVEANGLDRFAFTFTSECLVSISVIEEKGEILVELTQSRIPNEPDHNIYVDCSYGWAFYLGNLKSVLEGGIDLRNRNVEIHNVVNS